MKRVRTLTLVLLLLFCTEVGLPIITASPARAADDASNTTLQVGTPPAEVQAVLQNTASGEFACWAKYGRYGSKEELRTLRTGGFAALRYLTRCDIAVSEDGQRFVALAVSKPHSFGWFINQHGVIRATSPDDTTEGLLAIEHFFALKRDGVLLSHHEKLDVFRHYARWLQMSVERYAADHGCYPASMETVKREGYLGPLDEPGYYPNPITALDTSHYDAHCVRAGRWSMGDFSYIPIAGSIPGQPEGFQIDHYVLLFYGIKGTENIDIGGNIDNPSGVIIILSNNTSRSSYLDAIREAWGRLPMGKCK